MRRRLPIAPVVGSFPRATLLIGKGDWDVLTSPKPPENANPAPFANWIKGESKVDPVPLDKDAFGDGSVIMLYTPGHTPGHHSLLVKLPQMGTVFISGDLMHFRENYDTNGVPAFNTDRSQTLASLDRVKKIVAGSKATVVIQHDARDVDKLHSRPQRSNGRVSASAPSAGRCGALRDSAASAER